MKNIGFFWKIIITLTLTLLITGVAFVFITSRFAEKFYQEKNQRLNASIAQHIISEVKPFIDGELSDNAVGDIMHHMMAINPSIEVYILDPEGKILSYVAPYKKVKLESVDLGPVNEFLKTEGQQYITGDDPRNPGVQKVFSAAAIKTDAQESIGYVYVVLASEEYESVSQYMWNSYILRLGGRSLLVAFLASFVLGGLMIWLITKNLDKIIATVNRFRNGEMSARITYVKKGGINDLAIAFNEMADTIVGNIEDLKSMENLRRELVGNVSHDLRTPISVIHGYIETLMIKNESLTIKEKDEYLNIILQSTQKLKKLVDELFELSKLEARQIIPKKEPFHIHELINDICQKYQVIAEQKSIKIISEKDENQGYLVYADLGLIERVLQNLIDNALKFTPENGQIKLNVSPKDDFVDIEVSDSGPGIPKEQMPFIFDRYHIGDKRISLDHNSTGLGLAIVKKILEIHGVSIKLSSQINTGTTFNFQLPQYTNS
ncbi:MAG: HAMP domain-containing sensor histidine kinase [Fulvivirga sp.]